MSGDRRAGARSKVVRFFRYFFYLLSIVSFAGLAAEIVAGVHLDWVQQLWLVGIAAVWTGLSAWQAWTIRLQRQTIELLRQAVELERKQIARASQIWPGRRR